MKNNIIFHLSQSLAAIMAKYLSIYSTVNFLNTGSLVVATPTSISVGLKSKDNTFYKASIANYTVSSSFIS